MTSPSIAVVILTYNEEKHIGRCLRHAQALTDEVHVVDSFSSDATVEIAQSMGAQVWQHPFENHARQLEWALAQLPIAAEWVMRIDADEIVSPPLAAEIHEALLSAPPSVNGFLVFRQVCFQGAPIRHGGVPHWVLRLWRKGMAKVEQRWMDEHVVLKEGTSSCLRGDFLDDNLNGVAWWTDKHNGYSTREAIDLLNYRHRFRPMAGQLPLPRQARRIRWFKENLYARLPLGLRAFLFFVYRMVFRLGILDGRGGFVFHFLQGYWYRFLVDVKVRAVEQRMQSDGVDCAEAIRREFGVEPLL
ncbi:MAG: glycosyltransferase family 2 protein [Actinomycetota bacterium]